MAKKEKKFRDLKAGDSLFYISKWHLTDGVKEYVMKEDWTLNEDTKEHYTFAEGILGKISIPVSSFSKSNSSQLYDIYGTSREACIEVARKRIEKVISKLDVEIERTEIFLDKMKVEKMILSKLLTKRS